MLGPCKNCPDRVLLCHATCEKYLAYSENRNTIRQNRAKHNKVLESLIDTKTKKKRRF